MCLLDTFYEQYVHPVPLVATENETVQDRLQLVVLCLTIKTSV